jgi:hypothetical protein
MRHEPLDGPHDAARRIETYAPPDYQSLRADLRRMLLDNPEGQVPHTTPWTEGPWKAFLEAIQSRRGEERERLVDGFYEELYTLTFDIEADEEAEALLLAARSLWPTQNQLDSLRKKLASRLSVLPVEQYHEVLRETAWEARVDEATEGGDDSSLTSPRRVWLTNEEILLRSRRSSGRLAAPQTPEFRLMLFLRGGLRLPTASAAHIASDLLRWVAGLDREPESIRAAWRRKVDATPGLDPLRE